MAGLIRGIFRVILGLLSARKLLAEKEIAREEKPAVVDALAAEALQPLPPPSRQPRTAYHVRSGWSEPLPESIPEPTYVPAAMAFGVVMVTLGILTRWFFVAIGAVIILFAAWHWIKELLGEPSGTSHID